MAAVVGKTSRKSDKLWRDALMVAVKRADDGDPRTLLARAAEQCARAAANGDIAAMKEIGDRLDGKPAQSVTVSGDADAPLVPTINVTIAGPSATPQTGPSTPNKRD